MSSEKRVAQRWMRKASFFEEGTPLEDLDNMESWTVEVIQDIFLRVSKKLKSSEIPRVQRVPKQRVTFVKSPEKFLLNWDDSDQVTININNSKWRYQTPEGLRYQLLMLLGIRYYRTVLKSTQKKNWVALSRVEKAELQKLLKATKEKMIYTPNFAFGVAFASYLNKMLPIRLKEKFEKVVGIESKDTFVERAGLGIPLDPNRFENIVFNVDPVTEKEATDKFFKYFPYAEKVLGRVPTLEDMADLVGATAIPGGVELEVKVNFNSIRISGKGPHVSSFDRWIQSDGSIYNDLLVLQNAPKGTGTKIFASQVQAASKLGASEITCVAAKEDTYVGYKVWYKLGYDGLVGHPDEEYEKPIPKEYTDQVDERNLQSLTRKQLGEIFSSRDENWEDDSDEELKNRVRDILDQSDRSLEKWGLGVEWSIQSLMAVGMEDWWQENGDEWDASFDLKEDSRSMEILKAYLEKKSGGNISDWFKTAAVMESAVTKSGGEFDVEEMQDMEDSYNEFIHTMPFPPFLETLALLRKQ